MFAYRSADADLSRLSQRFEPCRNIYAVTKNVTLVNDNITDINADTECDAPALGQICIAVHHPLLHHGGTSYSVDDRGKLDKNTVAGRLDNATLVLSDERINQFATMRLQRGERTFLVSAH
jgi:hypothetical protein